MNPIAANQNFAIEIQRAKSAGLIPQGTPVNRRAWETAQGLEANFFQTMLGTMFAGLEGEGPMGSGPGQDAWRGMMLENYGKDIAAKGGIGLAPQIYREMLRNQELSPNASQRNGV
ncbi:chemotactic signal-response protein CheL [Rhabdaerophilaceae bacterium]